MEEIDQSLCDSLQEILSIPLKSDLIFNHAVLDFNEAILQFTPEDKGLGLPFSVNVSDRFSRNANRIFNNSHYHSVHSEEIFSTLVKPQQIDLKESIENELGFLDYSKMRKNLEPNRISEDLKSGFQDVYASEFNIQQQDNEFSSGFQYNELSNALCGISEQVLNPIFKNFSSDGYSGNIFQIGEENSKREDQNLKYQKDKFLPYQKQQDMENDFSELAEQIEAYCQSLPADNPKFDRTVTQINLVNDPKSFDCDKANQFIKSSFETSVVRRNRVNLSSKIKTSQDIIEEAEKRLEMMRLPSTVEEENQKVDLNVNAIQEFKNIGIKDQTKMNSKSKEWAMEDSLDISSFHDKLPKERMAIKYPFELDNFQKRSVLRLEEGQNVFVCAHTSAGKTVVAEYSIALAIKNKRKAIYTSPIKALSNQKYRDFREKFGDDVGIITGDVSLNPSASCLIVTTEVLRNMLYKGHDIVRDIAWVIFDEVHYINNSERGVVWEETIILLPESIGLVMLSATVPNYMNFANWVGRTKQRKIFVQKTMHRPVPLEHSIYYEGKLFQIKSTDEKIIQGSYEEVVNYSKEKVKQMKKIAQSKGEMKAEKKKKDTLKNTNQSQSKKARDQYIKKNFMGNQDKPDAKKRGFVSDIEQVKQILKYCQKNNLLPCVVFCFSKKTIQNLSESLNGLTLVSKEESLRIEEFFNRAARKLKPRDLQVNQIKTLKSLMIRGIAVHHGDVIPFIKEVVEILFSQGLIKVLFATETFAMGINMPTKTVIFYSVKKFDSTELRYLNSSEYTQMSGRAGRRGIDEKGNVIILISEIDKLPSKLDLSKMLDHKGEQLASKFKVNYELILKLLSSRELDVTEMMKKSFIEDSRFSQLPQNLKKLDDNKKSQEQMREILCPKKELLTSEIPMEDYFMALTQTFQTNVDYWNTEILYLKEEFKIPSFCEIIDSNQETFLALIVNFIKSQMYANFVVVLVAYELPRDGERSTGPSFLLEKTNFFKDESSFKPIVLYLKKKEFIIEVLELPILHIQKIFDFGPEQNINLRNEFSKKKGAEQLIKELPNYNKYRADRGNGDFSENKNFPEVNTLSSENNKLAKTSVAKRIDGSKCHNCELKLDHKQKYLERQILLGEEKELLSYLDDDDLSQQKNFSARLDLLHKFNYIDDEKLPLLKSRLAKELDNIYVSEIILEGYLDNLDEAELAAILICFVTQAKTKDEKYDPVLNDSGSYNQRFLDSYTKSLKSITDVVKEEMKLEIVIAANEDEYIEDVFCTTLIKVAYEWLKGKDFLHVSLLTSVQEGTIIRCMLRLDNLMKNIKSCVQYIGNNTLSLKIDAAQELMRRDIIFAQSLYLEEDN